MINEFYEKAHTFSFVEDIEERLPVFSHNHGVAFWNVLSERLSEDVKIDESMMWNYDPMFM